MFACKLNTDANQPVAIEIVLPDSGRVELTDTFRPSGRALNGFGDSVAAPLFWSSLDPAIIAVLDSTTGVTWPKAVGTGRLLARTGTLFSNPQNVVVLARLDSMAAASPTHDTLDVTPTDSTTDSLSNPQQIQTVAFGGLAVGRRVVYAVTAYPGSGPVVTLLPRDTVFTGSTGGASVQVRLHPGPLPDSVVVTASMTRFDGSPLPGSPVVFVVEILP
ncbi:MAG TPA: hypothetical protein VEK77_02950 [Gemmatimonadales bacterium]|nr:hypothetical protein [Gemmatimonadales bacterium]